jgi:chorismate mutase
MRTNTALDLIMPIIHSSRLAVIDWKLLLTRICLQSLNDRLHLIRRILGKALTDHRGVTHQVMGLSWVV